MSKTFIGVPSTPLFPSLAFTNNNQNNSSQLINTLSNPMALTLIGIFGLYGLLSLMGNGSKKGKLSTAYWGGKREKRRPKTLLYLKLMNPLATVLLYISGLLTLYS
ncbi:hypothetical protein CWATWH0402_105 [Crocosphaera watsonii WH 0402]|uniref:Uncharacterized protein n=1 Tax=Crocosphaera watsonii WH 0402 TaxID=1284629 RepID=T2JJW8_CROWT|nr:hypothetical protein CWATWH0402_105 [Crocosphaera watsonii WH 0402]